MFYVIIRGVMTRKEMPFDRELFFKALADPTRLRIINLIGDQEVCVCFFVEILKTNQPKISRHLAYLRRAGIVAARGGNLDALSAFDAPGRERGESASRRARVARERRPHAAGSKTLIQDLLCTRVAGPTSRQSETSAHRSFVKSTTICVTLRFQLRCADPRVCQSF